MRPLSDSAYQAKVIELGRKLVATSVIPELKNDPYFRQGYARNLIRTGDHLWEWRQRTDTFHPEHHLFVGHAMLYSGYIVFGADFDSIAVANIGVPLKPDQVGHKQPELRTVNFGTERRAFGDLFELYAEGMDMRGSYRAYEELRDKASLREQVDIIERHVEKIPTISGNQQGLEDVMFRMALATADSGSGLQKFPDEVVRHVYLLGALIKRIHATEQLHQRGIDIQPQSNGHTPRKGSRKKSR